MELNSRLKIYNRRNQKMYTSLPAAAQDIEGDDLLVFIPGTMPPQAKGLGYNQIGDNVLEVPYSRHSLFVVNLATGALYPNIETAHQLAGEFDDLKIQEGTQAAIGRFSHRNPDPETYPAEPPLGKIRDSERNNELWIMWLIRFQRQGRDKIAFVGWWDTLEEAQAAIESAVECSLNWACHDGTWQFADLPNQSPLGVKFAQEVHIVSTWWGKEFSTPNDLWSGLNFW